MIGLHGQKPINDWLNAIRILPANAPFLAVDDVHMLRDAKGANPSIRTIFRKYWSNNQGFTSNYEEAKNKARQYFNSFIDGTWQQQEMWRYVDIVKEWNEYVASSQNEAERQQIITWLQAVTTVWNTEYRGKPICGGRDIPLACLSVAIGNNIDPRYAKIIADSNNIISYHNYTHFNNGVRDPLDWQYHSGRWTVMDAQFKAQGITVKWISTEGGPYNSVSDGWKSSKVLSGNLQRYIDECIKYQIDKISAWNKVNNNRYLGGVLFTFGNTGAWPMYELTTNEMIKIAETVRDYSPSTPEVPSMSWQQEAWNDSVQKQIQCGISLNPNALLQKAILAAGLTPVMSEYRETYSDGVRKAFMAGEDVSGQLSRRLYWSTVPPQGQPWPAPQWFNDPKA